MLVFTNRDTRAAADASAFKRSFQPGATLLSAATVASAGGSFALDGLQSGISDDQALQALVPVFGGNQPVLVYLHGNNNSPADCFERCARLEEIYGCAVVGFSWPSEGALSSGEDPPGLPVPQAASDDDDEEGLAGVNGSNRTDGWVQRKIQRYWQAKMNASAGVDALARFLRLLATARLYVHQQPMSLAAHSLGAHFLQNTIEVSGATEALGAQHNIALLAPCCRASGHETWLAKLAPRGQVFITFNQGDIVLYGARIADHDQPKLGAEPDGRLVAPKVRYVSFTNAPLEFGGHHYFVRKKLPKDQRKVFGRMFSSERDIREDQGEYPRKVYPLGCDADGATCYMAKP